METLFHAIDVLYSPTSDPATIRQANTWLMNLQQGPDAWQCCMSVLSNEVHKEEYLLFCASTLRSRCKSESFVPSLLLANEVCPLVHKYAPLQCKPLTQQLCMVLCSCIPPDYAVEYIMAAFSEPNHIATTTRLTCLYSLLECVTDNKHVKKHAMTILNSLNTLSYGQEDMPTVMACARAFMMFARERVPLVSAVYSE